MIPLLDSNSEMFIYFEVVAKYQFLVLAHHTRLQHTPVSESKFLSVIDDMQIAEDLQLIIGHMIMQWLCSDAISGK